MTIETTTLLRWPDPDVAHLALLRSANVETLVLAQPNPAFSEASRRAGMQTVLAAELPPVVTDGLWPGVRRGPSRRAREVEVASASSEPWVDANGYLVAFHRALKPAQLVLLAYEANEKAGVKPDVDTPFGTVELALVEARVAGGNFVLDLPQRFRERLLAADPKALEAWQSLGKTAAWLKQNSALLGHPVMPEITALVEPGAPTREIANLLHRRGASPLLKNAADPVRAEKGMLAMVAAGLKEIPAACFSSAETGAILVIDRPAPNSAKLIRQEADRSFYSLGSGKVVAYNRRIADPSEFAMDVIDLITHKRRATRLWNVLSAIPLATAGERAGEALLHIVNYGSPATEEFQAHIQGHFSKATLLSPEKTPMPLKTVRRGSSTEVFVPSLRRLAVVRFSN